MSAGFQHQLQPPWLPGKDEPEEETDEPRAFIGPHRVFGVSFLVGSSDLRGRYGRLRRELPRLVGSLKSWPNATPKPPPKPRILS